MALCVGGLEPLTPPPLCSLHVRLTKNKTAAARNSKTKVAPALMPAVASFERPGELLPCGFSGIPTEAELDAGFVVVVFTSELVFGLVEEISGDETPELAEILEVTGGVELSTELDVVGGSELVDEAELVEDLELIDECELVESLRLVEGLDVDVAVDVAVRIVAGGDFLKGAALSGLLESFAPTTSSAGHSVSQALDEQHPKKGLSKSKHVYQSPFGSRHSWSVMFAPFSLLKLEYRTSSSGQYYRYDQ